MSVICLSCDFVVSHCLCVLLVSVLFLTPGDPELSFCFVYKYTSLSLNVQLFLMCDTGIQYLQRLFITYKSHAGSFFHETVVVLCSVLDTIYH